MCFGLLNTFRLVCVFYSFYHQPKPHPVGTHPSPSRTHPSEFVANSKLSTDFSSSIRRSSDSNLINSTHSICWPFKVGWRQRSPCLILGWFGFNPVDFLNSPLLSPTQSDSQHERTVLLPARLRHVRVLLFVVRGQGIGRTWGRWQKRRNSTNQPRFDCEEHRKRAPEARLWTAEERKPDATATIPRFAARECGAQTRDQTVAWIWLICSTTGLRWGLQKGRLGRHQQTIRAKHVHLSFFWPDFSIPFVYGARFNNTFFVITYPVQQINRSIGFFLKSCFCFSLLPPRYLARSPRWVCDDKLSLFVVDMSLLFAFPNSVRTHTSILLRSVRSKID